MSDKPDPEPKRAVGMKAEGELKHGYVTKFESEPAGGGGTAPRCSSSAGPKMKHLNIGVHRWKSHPLAKASRKNSQENLVPRTNQAKTNANMETRERNKSPFDRLMGRFSKVNNSAVERFVRAFRSDQKVTRKGGVESNDMKAAVPLASTQTTSDDLQSSDSKENRNKPSVDKPMSRPDYFPPIAKLTMRKWLVDLSQKGIHQLRKDYTDLKTFVPPNQESTGFANNISLCRYKDVKCYDNTRVILTWPKNNPNDFIHANWVKHDMLNNVFICAQGPMEKTSNDFWRMVWQENVQYIIMLCKIMEKNKKKCHSYWPQVVGQSLNFERITVTTSEIDASDPNVIVSKITIQSGTESRTIIHRQWGTWPDRSVPLTPMIPFRLLQYARQDKTHPTIVHCSAGVGRTGTLVLIEMLLGALKHGIEPDSKQFVKDLRTQRAQCIQTEDQFVYAHYAVVQILLLKKIFSLHDAAGFCKEYVNYLKLLNDAVIGQKVLPLEATPPPPPGSAITYCEGSARECGPQEQCSPLEKKIGSENIMEKAKISGSHEKHSSQEKKPDIKVEEEGNAKLALQTKAVFSKKKGADGIVDEIAENRVDISLKKPRDPKRRPTKDKLQPRKLKEKEKERVEQGNKPKSPAAAFIIRVTSMDDSQGKDDDGEAVEKRNWNRNAATDDQKLFPTPAEGKESVTCIKSEDARQMSQTQENSDSRISNKSLGNDSDKQKSEDDIEQRQQQNNRYQQPPQQQHQQQEEGSQQYPTFSPSFYFEP